MAKSRHSRRRSHRRRHQSVKFMGGDSGSTQHAIDTYGGIGQQHPVSAVNNTIAVKGGSASAALSPATYGGGIITDISVPAGFVYARNVLSRRNRYSSKQKSRKYRTRK
jgi:hypothetical protein